MRLRTERIEVDRDLDLCLLAAGARDRGDDVMLFDDPAESAPSIAAIGRLCDIVAGGDGTLVEDAAGTVVLERRGTAALPGVCELWQELAASSSGEDPAFAVGGFAFRPEREPVAPWSGFPAALLRVPEVVAVRRNRTTEAYRIGDLDARGAAAPPRALLRPDERAVFRAPAEGRLTTTPARPAHRWMASVDSAIEALRGGRGEKVVLARELVAHGDGPLHAGSVVRELKRRQPSCYVYLVPGSDGSALVGASPELLVRRDGKRATSQPMAGTAARGRDAQEDGELARALQASPKQAHEHRLVVEDVRARYLAAGAAPVLVAPRQLLRFQSVQHLATSIAAHFSAGAPTALELCALLHPTAAVGGVPWPATSPLIDECEQMERGWYAGAVGWTDSHGDGAFTVTLRCGLLWEDGARLYAGAGVMPDSSSLEELQETDVKFLALLEALRASLRTPPPTALGASARSRPA